MASDMDCREKPACKRPRTRRGCVEDHLKFRQQILDAAKGIYHSEGIDKLTIRALANTLAISPMLVYHYFADKTELITAMWDEILEQVTRFTFAGTDDIADPARRFRTQIEQNIQYWEQNPDQFKLVFLTDVTKCKQQKSRLDQTLLYSELVTRLTATLRELAPADVSDERIALARDLRVSIMIGYLHSRIVNRRFPWGDLDRLRQATVESIVAAVTRALHGG